MLAHCILFAPSYAFLEIKLGRLKGNISKLFANFFCGAFFHIGMLWKMHGQIK
jgi:hypothetical protein